MWVYLPMYSSQTKRKKRVPSGEGKAKKPFRAPRQAAPHKSVIPGLLYQTSNEKKVLFTGDADATNIPLALNTTGSILALNLITVGSSMFNRVGRKIEMKSVRLCGYIGTIAAITRETVFPQAVRILIVYDRQTNGAYPAITDVIQDTEQTGANSTTAFSGINMNNRERFVTLMDLKFVLPQATATAGVLTNVFPNDSHLPIKYDEFRKLKGLTTHYKADSSPAVIGDISTGALYIISLGDAQAAGTELFRAFWNVRLKYADV